MGERASDVEPIDYTIGSMDISEQKATFNVVMGLTKWVSLSVAALLLLLVVWFGTSAGFIPAFISAAVMVVLGVWLLGKKEHNDRPSH